MANAKKEASGNWRVRIDVGKTNDGKRIMKSFTAPTKREAELKALQYTQGASAVLPDITFSECADRFFVLRSAVLSPSTIRGYKAYYKILKESYLSFYNRTIDSIDSDCLQLLVDDFAADHSSKSVSNMFGFITTVIRSRNKHAVFDVTLPQKKKPRLYIPTVDEVKKVIAHFENNKDVQIPIMLAAFDTMRRSEICAIDVERDVDFAKGTIHVYEAIVMNDSREFVRKTTKNVSSDRYIKPPKAVMDAIKKHGRITNYNPDSLSHAFSRALTSLGIPHFRFHDLRHYSISQRHALGIPDAYIMADSGHSTDYIMKNVYRHELSNERNKMIEKANSFFENIL